jgi:hypothetical protein
VCPSSFPIIGNDIPPAVDVQIVLMGRYLARLASQVDETEQPPPLTAMVPE